MKYKIHKTDTMPDVLGAIEAVKNKDQAMIKACNKIGDPVSPNKRGISEYQMTRFNIE